MPDFRITAQAPVDAIDRVGPAYDRGLGDATGSNFAALGQGILEGLDFGTKLDARLKQTARDNDPQKIAAEQLRADLANQATQELLNKSRLEYERNVKYGEYKDLIGMEGDILTNEGKRLDNVEKEVYGPELNESLIEQRFRSGLKGSGGKQLTPLEELGKKSTIFQQIEGKEDDKNAATGKPKTSFDYQKKSDPLPQAPLTPQEQLRRSLQNELITLEQDEGASQVADFSTQISQRRAASKANEFKQRLEQSRNQTRLYSLENFQKLSRQAVESYTMPNQYEDSSAGPIATLSATNEMVADIRKTKDPEEKAIKLQALNGISEVIDLNQMRAEAAEFYKGDELIAANKSIDAWAATTGNLEQMNPVAQSAYKLGLPPEYVEDSEKTMQLLDSVISKGWTDVPEPGFKNSLRKNPAVAAAQAAFERTPWFTTKTSFQAQGENSSDLNQDSGSIGLVKFYDSTGQDMGINVELNDEKNLAGLDLVEEWSRQKQLSYPQELAVNETISGIRGTQEQINKAPRNKPQQQAPLGAGPAAQPTATPEPQPSATPKEYSYVENLEYGPRSIPYQVYEADNVFVPLEPVTDDDLINKKIAEGLSPRVAADVVKDIRIKNKPYEKAQLDKEKNIDGDLKQVESVKRTLEFLEQNNQLDVLGDAGALANNIAKLQEFTGVTSTDGSRKRVQGVAEKQRLISQILKNVLSQGNVTSAVNTEGEQKAVVGAVFNESTPARNLKLWVAAEEGRVKKEQAIKRFEDLAMTDPTVNNQKFVKKVMDEYRNSPYSNFVRWNPEKFGKNGKIVPGSEDKPDLSSNVPEGDNLEKEWASGKNYMTPEQYMEYRASERGQQEQGTRIEGNPALQGGPIAPLDQTSSVPGTEKKSLLASAGKAIGDFLVPEAQAEELPSDGREALPGEELPEDTGKVTITPTPTATPDAGIGGEGNTAQPGPAPTPVEWEESTILSAENPAKTFAEERELDLDPDEEDVYNKFIQNMKDFRGSYEVMGVELPTAKDLDFFVREYAADRFTGGMREEGQLAFAKQMRKLGILPKTTTDRELQLQYAAWQQLREDFGEGTVAKPFLKAFDFANFLAQNIMITKGITGAASTVSNAPKVISAINKMGTVPKKVAALTKSVGNVAASTTADISQSLMATNVPGEEKTLKQYVQQAYDEGRISVAAQVGLGWAAKLLSPGAKGVGDFFSGKYPEADQVIAKAASERFGITKEQIEEAVKVSKQTGRDIKTLLPDEFWAMIDELAATPAAKPNITRSAAARAKTLADDTLAAEKATGMDTLPSTQTLQNDITTSIRGALDNRSQTAQMLADADRATALDAATKDFGDKAVKIANEVTEGTAKDVDAVVKQLDEAFRTTNDQINLALGTSQNPVENLKTAAAMNEAYSKYITDTFNNAYGNLDKVKIPIEDFEKFVKKLQTDTKNMPQGRAVIEDIAMRYKQGGPLKTTGLSDDAQSLIEMRSKLLKKLYKSEMNIEMGQAKAIIKEIDSTLRKTFAKQPNLDFSDDVFEKFINAQSTARALKENVNARREIIQNIQAVLDDPNPTPGLYKKFFGSSNKLDDMRLALGDGEADLMADKVKNLDDIIKTVQDIKKPSNFKPDKLDDIFNKAATLRNADFFMEQLMKDNNIRPERLAKLLGKKDRTEFGDAALRYLKNSTDEVRGRIDAGSANNTYTVKQVAEIPERRSLEQVVGVSKAEIDKAKTFMTPKQQAAWDEYAMRYTDAQRVASVGDAGLKPKPVDKGGKEYMTRRLVGGQLSLLWDIIASKYTKQMNDKEVRVLANAVFDQDKDTFLQIMEKASKNMPKTPASGVIENKAYGNYLDFTPAAMWTNAFRSAYSRTMEKQETDSKRKQKLQSEFRANDAPLFPDPSKDATVGSLFFQRGQAARKATPAAPKQDNKGFASGFLEFQKKNKAKPKPKLTQADYDVIQ